MAAPKTPVTLSAAERRAQLVREGKVAQGLPLQDMWHGISSEEIHTRLTRRDPVPALQTQPRRAIDVALPRDVGAEDRRGELRLGESNGSVLALNPNRIQRYDRNPRQGRNPRYDEIKESIRLKGLLNAFTVTRRPGAAHFMVHGGGNTRLETLQELAAEFPGNPLYNPIQVVFRAWAGEADVVAAHLIENDLRADTSFWDKACGLMSLKRELEAESGLALSSNDLRLKAVALGHRVSRQTIQLYDFALEYFAPIGPRLSFTVAQRLKDRMSGWASLVTRSNPIGGHLVFRDLVADVLARQASDMASAVGRGLGAKSAEADADIIGQALEARVALAVEVDVARLRRLLAIHAAHPQASFAQLQATLSSSNAAHRASPPSRPPRQPASVEVDTSPSTVATTALLDAAIRVARVTDNEPFLRPAARMPLGYVMDVPSLDMQQFGGMPVVPVDHQARLRRGGWQLLATLSGQFDRRVCDERWMPGESTWLHAVHAGNAEAVLARCGIGIDAGRIQLEAECLFFLLAEPRLVGPTVQALLSELGLRRPAHPNLLLPWLGLVTAAS